MGFPDSPKSDFPKRNAKARNWHLHLSASGLGSKLSILIPVSHTSYALVLGLLFAPPLPCTLIAVHCNSLHPPYLGLTLASWSSSWLPFLILVIPQEHRPGLGTITWGKDDIQAMSMAESLWHCHECHWFFFMFTTWPALFSPEFRRFLCRANTRQQTGSPESVLTLKRDSFHDPPLPFSQALCFHHIPYHPPKLPQLCIWLRYELLN